MWILLITALVLMSVLTILQTPRQWLERRHTRVLLLVYHLIGIVSLLLILFAVCRMEDGFLRELIIWTETCYVTIMVYTLLLLPVRYFGFELARHFRHEGVLRVLGSRTVFFLAAIIVSAVYMVPSVYNATHLRTVTYDIQVEKSCGADELSAAVISDFHIGAGARHSEMDQMVELIAEAKPDVVLIDGDVCDSSSSVSDLEYMEGALKRIDCRYGVFYVEGNHEEECRTDPEPYLLRAGVVILRDEGISLENGVSIIGRSNALKKDAAQIMADSGLNPDAPTIVMQHRTKGTKKLEGVADLAVVGHTHGYQFPFIGILMPYQRDISYGRRDYGDTHIIVSAGVSEWGYRTKWPSRSEVTLINLSFKEAEQ